MNNFKSQKGFTLIELLLYLSITAIMLLIISVFLFNILQSRIKNQTVAEVEGQGLQVMQIITQTMRNAESVISPTIGADDSSLVLNTPVGTSEQTVFDISNNTIRITENSNDAVALTNARVIAEDLIFQNLSRTDTPNIIRIQFTLKHVNPENRHEYSYEKTFISSAMLRDL